MSLIPVQTHAGCLEHLAREVGIETVLLPVVQVGRGRSMEGQREVSIAMFDVPLENKSPLL